MGPSTDPRRETNHQSAADMAALFIIVTIGVMVRAYHLLLPIKYDEALTFLNYAQFPITSGISNYSLPNNHVLHTLFVHLSVILFGPHEWVLRLPAFVFGALVVPATYGLGRMFSDGEAALVAAALIAGSSKLIEYSVNARGYTLLVLLSIALVAIGFNLTRVTTVRAWISLAVVASLGLFTIPTMLYVYVAVLLWIIASRGPDRVTLKWGCIVSLATFAITLVLYLPALLHSGPRALLTNPFVHPLGLHDFLSQAPMLPLYLWASWTEAVPTPVLLPLLIGLTISLLRDKLVIGLLLSFVIATAALMVFQRVVPPTRVFLFGLPILAICASSGLRPLLIRYPAISRLGLMRIVSVALAAWMAFTVVRTGSVLASEDTGSFQDADAVLDFLNATTNPSDLVLMVVPADYPFKYYLQLRAPPRWAHGWVQGTVDHPSDRLFIVLRDHHGPVPSQEPKTFPQTFTLGDIKRFYTARSEPKLAFSGPYSSVYIADGAAVKRDFCEAGGSSVVPLPVACFHKNRADP